MTSTTRQRWMQLDDRDASLNYTGTWFDDSYQQPLGTTQALGDLYRGTARGTNTAGVLKFNYNGKSYIKFHHLLDADDVLRTPTYKQEATSLSGDRQAQIHPEAAQPFPAHSTGR